MLANSSAKIVIYLALRYFTVIKCAVMDTDLLNRKITHYIFIVLKHFVYKTLIASAPSKPKSAIEVNKL